MGFVNTTAEKKSQTKAKLWIDLFIFIVFLVAMDPRSTGIAIHEWLTIASMAAMMTHLLLNWQWIVEVTRRFFKKTGESSAHQLQPPDDPGA